MQVFIAIEVPASAGQKHGLRCSWYPIDTCTIMSVYTYIYIIYIYIIHLHYTLCIMHYTCTYTYGCVYSHGLGVSISTYQTSPKKKSVAGDALGATTHAQEDFLFRLGQVQMMDRIILPIYMVPSGNLT